MIILVIAYRPLLGDQHWSVLTSRLDCLMRRLGLQRLGCLVSGEVWSVFGCLIWNMLVTSQCVCVCVHGHGLWMLVTTLLYVECVCAWWCQLIDSWVLVEPVTDYASPMVGNNVVLTADPLLCVPLCLYWVIEDVGMIDNLWLCESLIKIDHANPLVGKVKVAIWTCNSRTILLNWFVAKPPLGGRRFVYRGDVDWSMVMGLLQASHDWLWEYRIGYS
jgi:hypothetical protein